MADYYYKHHTINCSYINSLPLIKSVSSSLRTHLDSDVMIYSALQVGWDSEG